MKRTVNFLSVAIGLCAAHPALAEDPAVEVTSGSCVAAFGVERSVGWAFTPIQDIEVQQLGFWDFQRDGLNNSHEVGIFTAGGALLVSDFVSAGSGSQLIGNFRYVPIAPTKLTGGQQYVIAGHFPNVSGLADAEFCHSSGITITFDPLITPQGGRFRFPSGGELRFPTGSTVNRFGPNFTFGLITPEALTQDVLDDIQSVIDANSSTPLADKLEDAGANIQTALDELLKLPPDNQAAVGNIEGAAGDLEAALKDGIIDLTLGTELMDRLTSIARQLAEAALDEAVAGSGDPSAIAEAEEALSNGDALKALGAFKDAVNEYKNALAKAESALG